MITYQLVQSALRIWLVGKINNILDDPEWKRDTDGI